MPQNHPAAKSGLRDFICPLFLDSNKTLTANFAKDLRDPDNDGLTTWQEAVVFETNSGSQDTDSDGLTDGYEIGVGRFRVVWGSFRWEQARRHALGQSSHLATFRNRDEWDAALVGLEENPFPYCTGLWIGATDAATEGVWTWVTGEPFSFNLWAPGQPNNFPGEQDVAEVSGWFGAAAPGEWLDTSTLALREGYLLEEGWPTDPVNADTDGDGYFDGAEAEFLGNPVDPASLPRVRARVVLDPAGSSARFRFLTDQGSSYAIESSTNMTNWQTLDAGITGTGGTISRDYPLEGFPKRYFRAGRE